MPETLDTDRIVKAVHEAAAMVFAAHQDQPLPQAFYAPWASQPTISRWRAAGLTVVERNGKILIRPSVFFAALEKHGYRE